MHFLLLEKKHVELKDNPKPGSEMILFCFYLVFRNLGDMPAQYSITVMYRLKTSLLKSGDLNVFLNYDPNKLIGYK